MDDKAAVARAAYRAYEMKDRGAIEAVIAKNFSFSSPYDDRIDREEYFRRCWPNHDMMKAIRLESVAVVGDFVLVLYELETVSGAHFRNMERLKVEDGKITEVEVFFGDPPMGHSKEEWRAKAAG